MKGEHLSAASFFVLRTPLLPTKALFASTSSPKGSVEDATRQVLAEAFGRRDVRRAMEIGTEGFLRIEKSWQLCRGDALNSAGITLLGYLYRMVGRPTPFGLFAGVSLGAIGGSNSVLELDRDADSVAHLRPSLRAQLSIAERALRVRGVIRRLEWETSPGAFRAGGAIRFLTVNGGSSEANYVALELTQPIKAVLGAARSSSKFNQIVRAVAARRDAAAAEEFVFQLIDCGLLVPKRGHAPPINDPQATELGRWLRGSAPAYLKELRTLRHAVSQVDEADKCAPRAHRKGIEGAKCGRGIHVGGECHAELHRLAKANLSDSVARTISRTLVSLRNLGMGMPVTMQLERERFVDRFGDESVPLLEALDPECGIASPRPARRVPDDQAPALRTDVTRALFQKVVGAERTGQYSIAFDECEIPQQSPIGAVKFAERLLVVGTLLSQGEDQRQLKPVFHLRGAYGSNGAHLIARHAWANAALRKEIRSWLRRGRSEDGQVIQADVAHLAPRGAIDFASCPAFHDYEIVLDDRCARLAPERRLYLDDLFLTVRGNRFILHSRKLAKEVRPCTSSAHDPSIDSSIPYRFLCTLQHQDTMAAVEWNWGVLRDAPFLPQVTIGEVVVSPARWLLSPTVRQDTNVRSLANGLRRPRWVYLSDESDAPLRLLDLDQPYCATWLERSLRRKRDCWLTEVLPVPGPTAIGEPDCYMHELVIPFQTTITRPAVKRVSVEAPPRHFAPGTEWLYLKLYAGQTSLDAVIRWVDTKLLSGRSRSLKCWYFVRYADPEWHLRLRLRAPVEVMRKKILPELYKALSRAIEGGLIHRAQLDTYVPERARYGGVAGLELSERLFHRDSMAVVALIRDRRLGEDCLPRQICLAAVGVDQMLTDFGITEEEWRSILDSARELSANSHRRLMPTLSDARQTEAENEGRAIFQRRSREWSGLIVQMRQAIEDGACSVSLVTLVAAHAHMHINRILSFPSEPAERAVFEVVQRMRSRRRALAPCAQEPPKGPTTRVGSAST
jgi:lantibiotic biosynthesis protein